MRYAADTVERRREAEQVVQRVSAEVSEYSKVTGRRCRGYDL